MPRPLMFDRNSLNVRVELSAPAASSGSASPVGDFPGTGGEGCFSPETLVLMGDGSARPIRGLSVGEEIDRVRNRTPYKRGPPGRSEPSGRGLSSSRQIHAVRNRWFAGHGRSSWAVLLADKPGFAKTLELNERLDLRVCSLTHTVCRAGKRFRSSNQRQRLQFENYGEDVCRSKVQMVRST